MKNSFTKILSLVFILMMITGCVRYNADMTIRDDKSMIYSMTMAVDSSKVQDDSISFTNEDKRKLESKGFYVEDYVDGDFKGLKITLDIGNIDRLSTDADVIAKLSDISNNTTIFKIKKGTIKNRYTFNLIFENDSEPNSNENQLNNLSQYIESGMESKFTVNLPYKPLSNNATNVEPGNKLIWDMTKHQGNITFEFELYNIKPMQLAMGGGLILIIILIVVLIKFSAKTAEEDMNTKNNKSKNDYNNYNNYNSNYNVNIVPPHQDEIRNNFVPLEANGLYNDMINNNQSVESYDVNNNNTFDIPVENNFNQSADIDNANTFNNNSFDIPEPIVANDFNTNQNNMDLNIQNDINTQETFNIEPQKDILDDYSYIDKPNINNNLGSDTQNIDNNNNNNDTVSSLDNSIVIDEPVNNDNIIIEEPISSLDNSIIIDEPVNNDNIIIEKPISSLDNSIIIDEPINNDNIIIEEPISSLDNSIIIDEPIHINEPIE